MKISNPNDYSAALYIRLSKEDDGEAESQSVANQRRILSEYATEQKLSVYDVYIDDGVSGTTFDRPGFCRMIKDIEAKRLNMVITRDMSRLGRDYIQTGYYMEKYFPEMRVRYLALLDSVDTGVEGGANDISPFRAIINDMYAKDTSRKIRSVKNFKQKQGLFIGGKAYYGYRLSPDEKNKIIIDEEAAVTVRHVFSMAILGSSCREIAGALNDEGVPTPAEYAKLKISRGGKFAGLWSGEKVSDMLKNQVYIGNMVQGRVKKLSYKSKMIVRLPKEEWSVVEGTHEPIIDAQEFYRVGELLSGRSGTRRRKHEYLLKGLFYCRECKSKLGVISRRLASGEALYFFCRNYKRLAKIEGCTYHGGRADRLCDGVSEYIADMVGQCTDAKSLAVAAYGVAKARRNSQSDTPLLTRRLGALSRKLDALYEDKANGMLDKQDFAKIYAGIKSERAEIEVRLAVAATAKEGDAPQGLYDSARQFITEAYKNRQLMFSLIDKIELGDDKELILYVKFCNAF